MWPVSWSSSRWVTSTSFVVPSASWRRAGVDRRELRRQSVDERPVSLPNAAGQRFDRRRESLGPFAVVAHATPLVESDRHRVATVLAGVPLVFAARAERKHVWDRRVAFDLSQFERGDQLVPIGVGA